MKRRNGNIAGFILFFFTAAFCVGIGMFVNEWIQNQTFFIKCVATFFAILLPAILFFMVDIARRQIMIYRPLEDVLKATERMGKGDFNIKLLPRSNYNVYDEFDLIKEDLNRLAKELSKNEVLKNDFIANVSHEIKTPLSVITNYATVLKQGDLSKEEQQKYLDNLNDACKRLSNLISNILKLNKLENNKLVPEFKKFNLSESLTNQILQYEDLIEKRNLTLECDIEEGLYIVSEESYLEIIWNNLISNAIKFSNDGGNIKISLHKKNNLYVVKVKDNGCGIDKESGKHIFDKFYQGDTSHSKEGNGLGLALVKKVIDVLGGSIKVDSEINKGTTFTVKIQEV